MSELLDKNKVKELHIRSVEITCIDSSVPKKEQKEYYEEFDDDGNTRLSLFYDGDGRLVRRTSFHYDMDNRLTRKMYFDISRNSIVREDYVYDKQNRLLEIKTIKDEEVTHKLFTYDPAGNVREIMKCDSSGGIHELNKFIYDNNNASTGKIIYDAFGKILSRTMHNFDGKGRKVKTITYHSNGDPHIVEHFDEKGRVKEVIDYGSGIDLKNYPDRPEDEDDSSAAPASSFRMEVTENGDIIGRESIEEDDTSPAPETSFVTRHIFAYDNKDCCTEETVFDSKGAELYRISQKYDDNLNRIEYKIEDSPANWFKTESVYNDKGLLVEERLYSGDSDPGKIRKFTYT
jgi:hypothetical protein